MAVRQSNMIATGIVMHVLMHTLLTDFSMAYRITTNSTRKVLVKEIRFSVGYKGMQLNVSVKNGVGGEDHPPNTTLFKPPLDDVSETENQLVQAYHAHLQEYSSYTENDVKSEIDSEGLYHNKKDKVFQNTAIEDYDEQHPNTGGEQKLTNLDGGGKPKHGEFKESSSEKSSINDKHVKDINKNRESDKEKSLIKESVNEKYIVNEKDISPKIVGGSLSLPSAWPWQVSIQYFGDDSYWHHFCGGSLIHNRWVITAAHCVCKLEDYMVRVVLGDYRLSVMAYREQVVDPARIFMHAYYETSSYYFDIAMIKLAERAKQTNYVNTVEMASPSTNLFDGGQHLCYITGWGNTIGSTNEDYLSDYLLQSDVSVISQASCQQTYGSIIETSHICVTGDRVSACSGDSGGPLVCEVDNHWILAGIASWVGSETCATEYPNVYSRMSAFHDWASGVIHQY